jgi:hypothetical protein
MSAQRNACTNQVEIKKLGSINVGAIENIKRFQKDRIPQDQIDDIEKSKHELEELLRFNLIYEQKISSFSSKRLTRSSKPASTFLRRVRASLFGAADNCLKAD